MREPKMLPPEDFKPRKKKPSGKVTRAPPLQRDIRGGPDTLFPALKEPKALKRRNLRNEASPSFQQTDRSTSDSLPDSSISGSEYRVLRRKYLLLEEESCQLGRDLTDVEADVKILEDEKLALLDQLVVLEGLVDPSDLQPRGGS